MADIQAVGLSNAGFGLDLYKELSAASPDSNVFFSPVSILLALAMTLLGAKDKTETELKSVLRLDTISDEDIHPLLGELIKHLQNTKGEYEFTIANKLYGEKSYQFLKNFTDECKKHYGAGLEAVDFKNRAKELRLIINKWVETKTSNKIKNLLPEGVLDELTKLVIINAVYFKGNWKTAFDEKNTKIDKFHSSERNSVDASFMHFSKQKLKYKYYEGLQSQILELPYVGDSLSFIIILPDLSKTQLSEVEKKLTRSVLLHVTQDFNIKTVSVWLPKFKLELQHDVLKSLKKLGIVQLFSESEANLSRMTKMNDLFVSEVIHKAFIEVNEIGTEATAATGIVITKKTAIRYSDIKLFRADHPFIFLIKDNKSGAVLFMGKLMKP